MKYTLLALLVLSFPMQSQIFLECKPTNKKNKEEINHDLLVVMAKDGFSSYFNQKVEKGIYLYNDKVDEFNKAGSIYTESFYYYSRNIEKWHKQVRSTMITVSRKNLEGTADFKGIKSNNIKRVAICEMRNSDEFSELIYSQLAKINTDNIF